MAENTLSFDKQIQYNGNGYLDKNIMPVGTYAELNNIPFANCFKGLEVVVLQDENYDNETTRYIYNGTKWVIKNPTIEVLP